MSLNTLYRCCFSSPTPSFGTRPSRRTRFGLYSEMAEFFPVWSPRETPWLALAYDMIALPSSAHVSEALNQGFIPPPLISRNAASSQSRSKAPLRLHQRPMSQCQLEERPCREATASRTAVGASAAACARPCHHGEPFGLRPQIVSPTQARH